MATGSPHFVQAEKELTDSTRPELKSESKKLRSIDSDDSFAAGTSTFLSHELVARHTRNIKRGSLVSLEE